MSWTESHGFSMFGKYNLTQLDVDEAWLNVTNLASGKLWLYELSQDCFECPYVLNWDVGLEPGENAEIKPDTKFPTKYRLYQDGSPEIIPETNRNNLHCEVAPKMGEFGIYELEANGDGCSWTTVLDPVSIYLPFLIPFFFYLGLGVVLFLFNRYKSSIYQLFKKSQPISRADTRQLQLAIWYSFCRFLSDSGPTVNSSNKQEQPISLPKRTRLQSLDTFRGFTTQTEKICIMIMIFVHEGSAGYAFLDHSTWDGLYVADLVFPWYIFYSMFITVIGWDSKPYLRFLWIMGVCIPISIKSQVKRNTPKLTILRRIIVRSLKLIAIGVFLNTKGGPVELRNLRFPGVLQRFGLCYFVAATSVLLSATNNFVKNRKANNKYLALVQDVIFIWPGWLVTIAALILHTCLTFFLEVPGCPTGYLGPGGLHKDNSYPDHCIGGASGYIDRMVLTEKHIYKWPTAGARYRASAYDPEGILGTLTVICSVWLGVQAGLTMQVYPKHRSRLIRWAVWAVITGALAAALCGAKQTGGPIPLNKNLWSISFVLVLSCFALILLIFLYVVIDVLKLWSGTPFFEPGMNSILIYVAHLVANDLLPWHFRFNSMNTHFKRLVESLWSTSLWAIYAIYLFHRKFFWAL